MEQNKDVNEIIQNHENRISALENILSIHSPRKISNINKALPDHIIALRGKNFFSSPKTADETHKELQNTYHCELNRVAMALLRLADRKQLRKASKVIANKKYKAYVW